MRSEHHAHRLIQRLSAACVLALLAAGCASNEKWIERRGGDSPYLSASAWLGSDEPTFANGTLALAEPRGLDPESADQRLKLMELLEQERLTQTTPQTELALSELAARQADDIGDRETAEAVGYYAESLLHGYRALSVPSHLRAQGTTEQYNRSLQSLLRVMRAKNQVRPGGSIELPLSHAACSIDIELHSKRWKKEDFQSFEFAEDFRVMGLRNHYFKSGVGVPLIGIRHCPDREDEEDRFYPRKLCYPLTAFMRVEEPTTANPQGARTRLVLELHDPMDHESIRLAGRDAPLASDLTTPLAYYLDQPDLHEEKVSTMGLFMPDSVEQLQGLYMLEPFDPSRIPVVMVHGLWSSPATWMEMFNDLRSDPRIRSRYQFWFYLYPTAAPFWISASQLRTDMAELKAQFDPGDRLRPLDQMVLVGHSMGGLLSRLQTVESRQDFWRIVTDRDFSQLRADPETRDLISNIFFFRPDPAVRRVVTIGSPHRGSRFANGVTQWIGAKLISLPMQQVTKRQQVFKDNPGFFHQRAITGMLTSIDSLSPDSPTLAQLLVAQPAPWVNYHNVVGDARRSGVTGWFTSRGDGVVSLKSARLDDLPQLSSQIIVPEDHVALHRHPQSIEEVRRVLLEQIEELSPQPLAVTGAPRATPQDLKPSPTLRLVSGFPE